MISEKIRPHHLERKAILYVRQSSAHQVLHNRESSALQYAMHDRLIALGWSEIETVDDDLGRSAAGGVARAGFARMVAEVCLGKVGAVAAREVSRFARNSHDWQQLIEMCRVVDGAWRQSGSRAGACGLPPSFLRRWPTNPCAASPIFRN
jgi:Resolvase, N terminal domain